MSNISFASDNPPSEQLNVLVNSCHLNIDKIGRGERDKGDPCIIIYKDEIKIYDSRGKHKKAIGPDFTFNDIVSVKIKNGDSVKIVLADADILLDDILFSQESSNLNSIKQMLDGKHEKDGSWYKCNLLKYPPGNYQIQLVSSSIAKDDMDASIYKLKWWGYIEEADHLVFVRRNGKEIFTTGNEGNDCGDYKKWDNQTFEIQWKPNDKIEVGFYQRNLFINDKIFLFVDDTENSLDLLNGSLAGGKSKSSNIIFSRVELK